MKALPLLLPLTLFLLTTASCGSDDDAPATPMITRDDYLGSFSVSENCQGATDDYTATITAGSSGREILLNNLYNVNSVIEATVNGTTLTIGEQQDGFRTFSGSGSISDDGATVTVNFTISGFATPTSCRATFRRQ